MLALVLEGGGARGAFQAGAIRALFDNGYQFDAVVGTSVGALNGVMIAQGEFEKSYELWQTMEMSKVLDFEDIYAEKIAKMKFDKDTVKYLFSKVKQAVTGGGVDTERIRELLRQYIDEEKVRKSTIEFGLVTFSFSDFKPCELFKDDIPEGKLCDYIMASANFPGFKKCVIDDKAYMDGGLYDNLPINMIANKGYKDIVAITTGGHARKAKLKHADLNILYITPSEKPGTLLNFNNYSVAKSLKIGYYDGLRAIHGYKGRTVYLKDFEYEAFEKKILKLPSLFFEEMCLTLGLTYYKSKIINLVNICASISKTMKLSHDDHIGQVFISILEDIVKRVGFDRLQVLTFDELYAGLKRPYEKYLEKDKTRKSTSEKAFEIFLRYYR